MKVEVYSIGPSCSYCVAAKKLLTEKNIEFVEKNIREDSLLKAELFEKVPGAKTVPQIFIDGEHIGGYTELRTFLAEKSST